jgi:hypothetical protein
MNRDTRSAGSRVDRWASVEHGSSYQIEVLGARVDDLVKSAGGWLFDRSMAGWVVNVLLHEEVDTRPLRILGLHPINCRVERVRRMPSRALVVSAHSANANSLLGDDVAKALRRGHSEVTLWGSAAPAKLADEAHLVRYRMSAAAQAFKAQALLAASIPPASAPAIETFLDYAGWGCSDGSDSLRFGRREALRPIRRPPLPAAALVRPHFGG